MDGIVNGLLALVRCEEGKQSFCDESCAVGRVIEKTWAPFSSGAEAKRLKVVIQVSERLAARGDLAAVEIILTNIFANAVEYTPAGGDLEISARHRNGRVAITCTNSNADLCLEDLGHLCERFWRKDPSRHDSAHSGLGLAICQQLARLLQAELRLEMVAAHKFQIGLHLMPDHGVGLNAPAGSGWVKRELVGVGQLD